MKLLVSLSFSLVSLTQGVPDQGLWFCRLKYTPFDIPVSVGGVWTRHNAVDNGVHGRPVGPRFGESLRSTDCSHRNQLSEGPHYMPVLPTLH